MKKDEFIKGLTELLEIENRELDEKTDLTTLPEYDSLSIISIMAFTDENFNKQLKGPQVRGVTTVKSLMELIGFEHFE